MAGEWRQTTLGDFCPLSYGKGLASDARDESGAFPVYGSSGVVGRHVEALTSGPTVVIGRKGTVGAISYSDGPCWPIDTTFYVEPSDGRDQRFTYYLLKSLPLDEMNSDSAVPGLNRNAAHLVRVPVPPLPEQRAIAHILGTLDDKIENNRRMSATLEEMARALYRAWFVDFEPVRAKMAGRPSASAPGEIADLFPARLVDSELGEIPEGWRVGTIGTEFDLTMGQSPPGSTYNETGDGLPFFQGRTDFGFRFPSRRVYCTAPTRTAEAGDTLMSVRAPVGDLNMALEHCAIGRGVAGIRHRSLSQSYTYYAMENVRRVIETFNSEGTVFGSIGRRDFERIEIVEPVQTVVRAFHGLVSATDERILLLQQEIETLADARDTLLPKLVSGELRLSQSQDR